MIIKISVINTHNEKVVRIFNTEDIVLVGEEHQEPSRLYDAQGKLVSETAPSEKVYFILMKNCGQLRVDQANYDIVEKALLK